MMTFLLPQASKHAELTTLSSCKNCLHAVGERKQGHSKPPTRCDGVVDNLFIVFPADVVNGQRNKPTLHANHADKPHDECFQECGMMSFIRVPNGDLRALRVQQRSFFTSQINSMRAQHLLTAHTTSFLLVKRYRYDPMWSVLGSFHFQSNGHLKLSSNGTQGVAICTVEGLALNCCNPLRETMEAGFNIITQQLSLKDKTLQGKKLFLFSVPKNVRKVFSESTRDYVSHRYF